MKTTDFRFAGSCLILFLAGCCRTLPVLPEPLTCPIAVEKLVETCADPAPFPESATYGDVVGVAIADRQSLRACQAHDRLLVDSIKACNAAMEDYRQKIKAINEKFAVKP